MKRTPSRQEQDAVDRLVDVLHALMVRSQAVDSQPRTFDTGMVLSRAEIHTVQAIGRDRGSTLKALAARMAVTKGAASQMVTKLAAKGLVTKGRTPGNDKEVALDLTELGWRGFHAHERFHASIADAFKGYYGADLLDRLPSVTGALGEVLDVVEVFSRMTRPS